MTFGEFRDSHPRIRLTLPGDNGPWEVEFIVDTGFEGELALPGSLLRRLSADRKGVVAKMLADGSEVLCSLYTCVMEWDEEERSVEVLALGSEPLLGTRFLHEQHFHAEIIEGGQIVVEPL